MSNHRPEPVLPVAGDAEDPFDTALIGRLANELFADSGSRAPASPPVALAGFSEPIPSTPASFPASTPEAVTPSSAVSSRDIGLTGGFPSSHSPSAPPPVHPTVVGAEQPAAELPTGTESGGHPSSNTEAYEFGEPRWYAQTFSSPVAPADGGAFALPGLEPALAEPDLYFLRGLHASALPNPVGALSGKGFDIDGVRRDFPALHQRVNGRPLIWLDNAATTHKPQSVLDATSHFYSCDNSNIHRAAHTLAERSTKAFEAGREKVRQFLGARDAKEIVFVRGTTEGINLVAQSYGRQNIGAGDEIILSQLEHHANIVPWQILAGQVGATIRVIPINDRGELLLEELPKLFSNRTKIVSVTQVSNALGTVNPVEEIIAMAHAHGVPVLVDGAQSTPHMPVNVQAMDADFFVFSGHKVFGPTGIGALYGKAHLLEAMPPWQGGGHMIKDVTFERTVYNHPPEKFEAGTPDIAGVVGLGAAIDYMFGVGIPAIAAYEHALLEYATEALASVPGIRPIGTAFNKASVLGFVIPGLPNAQVAKHLDQHGIAVRAGHHCALPAVRHFGVESTLRPSLAFYNTYAEVNSLVEALHQLPRH